MKSVRFVLNLTVATLIGGLVAVGHAEDGVTKDEIKIGSFGPLAGPVYMYGKLAMNGLEALFDKVNQEGGIYGRKLKLVREDDACKPEGGIAAVKKLIYDDKVFAINGGGCSNSTLAARPEIVKAGIPFVVNSAVADGISSPPTANIFTTQLTATIESRAQLKYALDQKAKKIAVVAQHDAWGRSRYEPMMTALKEQSIKPVSDEEMTIDQNDGTAQALKLMQTGADAVLLVVYPKPAAVLIRDSLISDPKVVLLDEPAVGLSMARVAELDTLLRRIRDERGITLVMIEHVIRLVMGVSDRVIVMNSGHKIAEGRPDDIRRNPDVIEAYLGRHGDARHPAP